MNLRWNYVTIYTTTGMHLLIIELILTVAIEAIDWQAL